MTILNGKGRDRCRHGHVYEVGSYRINKQGAFECLVCRKPRHKKLLKRRYHEKKWQASESEYFDYTYQTPEQAALLEVIVHSDPVCEGSEDYADVPDDTTSERAAEACFGCPLLTNGLCLDYGRISAPDEGNFIYGGKLFKDGVEQ